MIIHALQTILHLNKKYLSDVTITAYTITYSELKTLEWWISGLGLNPHFFLISRLNIAWKTHDFNLQINYSTGYLDISF